MEDHEEICYSEDGSTFSECLDSVIDDVWNSRSGLKAGDAVTIYQGTLVRKTHSDYLRTIDIFDQMACQAWDDLGEFTDGYMDDINNPRCKAFEDHILKWLNENIPQPTFFGVKDIKEIKITLKE